MDLLHIAQRIRKLRKHQNLTVAQLASRSGFSKGFISRLENFRVTPSVKALNKICEALGISMSSLFNPEEKSPEFIFSKLSEGVEISRDDGEKYGINYFSLAYSKIGRAIDPFLLEYSKVDEKRGMLMHESDEFFIVMEGAIEFAIGDIENNRRMEKGDTLYLSKNIPHCSWLAEGLDYAKALIIYCA